jgi:hypothetical protein
MKTSAKQFMTFGNIGLVQIRIEPETTFGFKPGAPEIKSGGLVITEAVEGGIVGKLIALNHTDSYLLLTDADVLVGAKQNRVLNKSMLLAPLSKTVIDVSCIERSRWSYTSPTFSMPESQADPNLRKTKASSMSQIKHERTGRGENTQHNVWEHISSRMMAEQFSDRTESYHEMAKHNFNQKFREFPECNPLEGCNGLAVVTDGKVQCIDIFGDEDVYRYYFPMLRDSAFRTASTAEKAMKTDQAEAFFRVLETLDTFELLKRNPDELYNGAGTLSVCENESLIGFELSLQSQPAHIAVFCRE